MKFQTYWQCCEGTPPVATSHEPNLSAGNKVSHTPDARRKGGQLTRGCPVEDALDAASKDPTCKIDPMQKEKRVRILTAIVSLFIK